MLLTERLPAYEAALKDIVLGEDPNFRVSDPCRPFPSGFSHTACSHSAPSQQTGEPGLASTTYAQAAPFACV